MLVAAESPVIMAAESPVIMADRVARDQAGVDLLVELAETLQAPLRIAPSRYPLEAFAQFVRRPPNEMPAALFPRAA